MRIFDKLQFKPKMPTLRYIERATLVLSLLFIGLSVLLIYVFLFPDIRTQLAVPLHYNVHFGVDQFGAWWRIFTLPALGLGILILNRILGYFAARKDPILPIFYQIVTIFVQIILFVANIFVIILNLAYYG